MSKRMKRIGKTHYRVALLVVLLAGIGVATTLSVERLRWRAQVVALKIGGELPGIELIELLRMMSPGSPFSIERLVDRPNPHAVIVNPFDSENDIAQGEDLFRAKCASCHGVSAQGATAPALVDRTFTHGGSDWAIYRAITKGIAGTAMPVLGIEDGNAWQVLAYLRSLGRDKKFLAEYLENAKPAERISVPYARILGAENEPESWLTYSGTYDGQRYSRLEEINKDNSGDLALKWIYKMPFDTGIVQSTPIVVGARVFITGPRNEVMAIDSVTGSELWRYEHPVPDKLSLCCGQKNRGLAVLDDKLFLGTLDSHLLALDAASGDVIWDTEVEKPEGGFSITSAPLAVKDYVLVGVAGAEFGVRGFLDAYDSTTGKRLWRFYTIPAPGDPGNETWSGDSWKTGGASTWFTGTFDPDLNLVYWGVGNPSPAFNGDTRQGDNLYTCSIIALDVDTGRLAWHFQFTPHDVHDWDANQIPVLVDHEINGESRKLMLSANKNGFFYVLDRESGQFLHASAFAKQSWAESIDHSGRPVVKAGVAPSKEGALVHPGGQGATTWWPPSYNPRANLFYVPIIEQAKIFVKGKSKPARAGEFFTGSIQQNTGEPFHTAVRALVPATGAVKWEHPGQPRSPRTWRKFGSSGGTATTAGGLVFWGDGTLFFAIDADNGQELWRVNLGTAINAAPIVYASEGRQRVSVAAGTSVFTFGLPE